ncbi:NUDIX hydrolase [Kutzneria kofuensis]|uniref:8-oxo-dGTP pyrophosphatase MutT (NUDIX family) n=1 Tax=Kutzneria kofuensis TaxID=103725 RepID=A0A7W9KIF5_9PSEU|nr:NUDIX domain-containing protein [Kutzneria kofuensis]MBB5893188.1 8-oxo-dGTP pyrophosphatase MutT (NUDIX family) [Kutzneria kofuensis]
MPKRDYLDDPAAPKANSIVPAASAFVQDEAGRVLMIRRTDNDLWAIPGGGQDVGETIAQTAVRETLEETGIDIEITGLVGIYSNPAHVISYDDGEVRQEFSVCFRARPVGGEPQTSSESREVHWVEPADLDDLNIHPSVRLRIDHGLTGSAAPYYD